MELEELGSLGFLVTIAECGSLTKAADKLCLSQPAVSYRLARVERLLDATIFHRQGRLLTLTPVGERVLRSARVIESEIHTLRKDVGEICGTQQHVIRISTHCYTSYQWLPHTVKKMQAEFPNFDLRIVVGATGDPIKALKQDQIDIAITTQTATTALLDYKKIFGDEVFAVLPKSHPLAEKVHLTPHQLENEKLIVYSANSSPIIDDFLVPAGKKPKDVSYVPLTEGILEMVRAGVGITALANWVLMYQNMENLARVRLGKNGLQRNWNVIYKKESNTPLLTKFIVALKQSIGAQVS